MRYFANPSTDLVREAMSAHLLDCIVTPAQRLLVPDGAAYYCADNGCFGKGYPGDELWWAWVVSRIALHGHERCAFVVAPDVVSDAVATLLRSRRWLHEIRSLNASAAFVAQDGIELIDVPWDEFDVLFIGGTTAWKLGDIAAQHVSEALERGKRVHMGRVNSFKRLRYAADIGCASSDGTYIKFGPSINLPKVLAWLDRVNGVTV